MFLQTPLRIAQVAPVIYPTPPIDNGGTERIVSDLTEALVALGHEVTLIAPADSRTRARHLATPPSLHHWQAREAQVPPGVPGVLEACVLELLRRHLDEFDVIHCHGEFGHAALLGERRRQSLTTVHWRVDELDRQLFFANFPDLPVASISRAQGISIPTGNHLGTVYHGLDSRRFNLGEGSGEYLAFIGRMTDQKRPDRAIEVARATGRTLKLAGEVDVGNPGWFDRHVAPALGAGIEHVGALDDRQKQTFLGEASALLFPIDWPEPFGLVMIEAMACGTPVIAWRNGAVEEIVEQGVSGFIVESHAQAVEAVGRLPELDRRRVRQAFLERFGAERMAHDYVALYRALLTA
ncbi:glycosyltransferase family 4 protein [Halomonas dongshanensis]|uniref:Glycosyltransferase family 4 protein n=1 Tax=Halomonas dongshanensis TaxID=2890835 RepID=A0ABT2EFN8_9GAMM|nr:glycosyltransferase family 4 protein [Halomonas dongshanensis]MCS2610409.1 glycosyltransferase family 4 protein [Halomonas dongshanensis]